MIFSKPWDFVVNLYDPKKTSWWFQPPVEKYWTNWIISPGIGVKIKHIWNHQLEKVATAVIDLILISPWRKISSFFPLSLARSDRPACWDRCAPPFLEDIAPPTSHTQNGNSPVPTPIMKGKIPAEKANVTKGCVLGVCVPVRCVGSQP